MLAVPVLLCQATEDNGVSVEPPPYKAAVAGISSVIREKEPIDKTPNAQPSAPPLEQATSDSGISPELPHDISPLLSSTALDFTLNAPSMSDSPDNQAFKPLPLLLRQFSLQDSGLGSHLFPHQKCTVSWMLDVEAGKPRPCLLLRLLSLEAGTSSPMALWRACCMNLLMC